ncbi:MAG: bifunctional ADP-dependent NAD(P)H-hydrate dehydratase/NAD(P)H-hydrate epimerase, partial [Deltaproteobacteria bacterium]|nr:bifunctional ADP-dependent NAD(P)H-hydrate dehydratase/NAD(P)H-hydrate epimerase [Deltaproteobacteria bacterium]
MKISTVEVMRELDHRAIEELGIPGTILMEHAGHSAYAVLQERVGLAGRRVVVLCGAGNNGGDGFVVARKARSAGAEVRAFLLGSPDRFSDHAR